VDHNEALKTGSGLGAFMQALAACPKMETTEEYKEWLELCASENQVIGNDGMRTILAGPGAPAGSPLTLNRQQAELYDRLCREGFFK
jgi:hypothetical protein